jgi:glycosyltransferase involved in cell wall biosynthesis
LPGTVLILTYEFPPSGGGGVQRIAKFAKYLPHSGWHPIVVAANPVPGRARDESLLADVAGVQVRRVPARHVSSAIARGLRPVKGLRGSGTRPGGATAARVEAARSRPPLSSRASRWIAIPDDAALWTGPATAAAIEVGRAEGADVVLASGPPFSALVAGKRVAESLGVPFVADMRDPWDRNVGAWWPTRRHREASRRYEREALGAASHVTAVSDPIAQEATEFGAARTLVLPNGFDPADMPPRSPDPDGSLRLVYSGQLYSMARDPGPLFEGLAKAAALLERAPVLEVVGDADAEVQSRAMAAGVGGLVQFKGYVPHAEALRRAADADVGIVLIADKPGSEAVFTGKLFEYLGLGLSVLVCGPESSAAADLVTRIGAGRVVPPSDSDRIAAVLVELAGAKEQGLKLDDPDRAAIAMLDRSIQAAELGAVLDSVVSGGRS